MKTNHKQRDGARNARTLGGAGTACLLLALAGSAGAQPAAEAGAAAKGTAPAAGARPAGNAGAAAASGAPMQMTISMAPARAPVPAADTRGPNCSGAVREESHVVVPIGKSTLIPLPEPVRNRTVGNPEVVQATMVSPQTMYVLGRSLGTTNMIVQGRSGACSVINIAVNVDAGGLQGSLAQLMPTERGIRVATAADNLVLTGSVSSAQAAQQAVEIARAYAAVAQGDKEAKNGGVLNMLSVDTPQQVMLEVKVAEVSKTLLNQLGSQLNLQGGIGSWTGGLVTSLLTGSRTAIFGSKANNLPLDIAIDAQKNDSLVKILAEPNLVTLSGQEASFLAGGKIYIPVAQSNAVVGGVPTITLQEEEFGVGLKFTPTVLANGRINLKVAPEVSELSPTGATVTGATLTGQTILPVITTRRASTTVQMRDGESFAIGGLLQNNARGALKALPGAGEVPVLGALFRSTSFQQDMSELIFIITPRLVQPMQHAGAPLPTDSFSTPNPLELYLLGNMEGSTGKPAPAAPQSPAPAPAPQAPAPRSAPQPATLAPPPSSPPASPSPVPRTALPVGRPLAEAPTAAETSASRTTPSAAPSVASAAAPAAREESQAQRIARIEATAARLARARAATPAGADGKPAALN
ncbi:type II and III secretion system protein family protein [Cupriavidus gilardii]|uniref:Type II and III secretion system protein family protein n=3 Tax=Cupriavidus gilardii TaxID=82541 RepID=A0ABY4VZV8_9BURK|nr:type II and III secretion system protein family protein [Cupriavidus gilardii]USE80933.1 type II and III secretion system protein family protein [Cupriavidus gilardii]